MLIIYKDFSKLSLDSKNKINSLVIENIKSIMSCINKNNTINLDKVRDLYNIKDSDNIDILYKVLGININILNGLVIIDKDKLIPIDIHNLIKFDNYYVPTCCKNDSLIKLLDIINTDDFKEDIIIKINDAKFEDEYILYEVNVDIDSIIPFYQLDYNKYFNLNNDIYFDIFSFIEKFSHIK